MAGTTNNNQFNSHMYLSPNQQDLLLAALNSNNPNNPPAKPTNYNSGPGPKRSDSGSQQQFSLDGMDPAFFTSPQQGNVSDFGNFGLEESPYIDFLDPDAPFEFDPNDTSDLLIGSLPGDQQQSADGETENHNKRKSPDENNEKSPSDENDEDEEGSAKRREGDDKVAKKPGRKPLTSEPSTKRKAQNRAAQRAFRERKEKHLKDLETKVTELEKASDAANHENGLLRAQVERLQTELREYRKRLSANSTGVSRAPASATGYPSLLTHTSPGANNFQFEFPRFGTLPGSQIFPNGTTNGNKGSPASTTKSPTSKTPTSNLAQQNNAGRGISPGTQHGVRSPTEKTSPARDGNGFFSPVDGVNKGPSARGSTSSSTGQSRVFQFNSNSTSTNDSPSVSSSSHYGSNSSCGTSPEPNHYSPGTEKAVDTNGESYTCHATTEGEITFCEKLNMACGNPRNPVPRAMSQSDGTPAPSAALTSPNHHDFGLDWLANQNDNQFNPTLFGDYRESQAAVVGDGEFTGGFFSDAFPTTDFGSPFNFGDNTPSVQKPNPLEAVEKLQDGGEEEVVPGEDPSQLLSCHKIWDKLQSRPDFKDGSIDIDGLCTELRAKARCSESGVVVDTKDVEAALKRLPEHQN